MPPRIGEFGKAVAKHDWHAVLRPGFVDGHVDAVGLDHRRFGKGDHLVLRAFAFRFVSPIVQFRSLGGVCYSRSSAATAFGTLEVQQSQRRFALWRALRATTRMPVAVMLNA